MKLNTSQITIIDELLNGVENTTSELLDALSNLLGTEVLSFRENNTVLCLSSNVTNVLGRITDGLQGLLEDLNLGDLPSELGDTIGNLLG